MTLHPFTQKKRPEKDQSSEAKTIVLKAYKEIPAIAVEQAIDIHDQNGIDINSCQRLITSASCMRDIIIIIITITIINQAKNTSRWPIMQRNGTK